MKNILVIILIFFSLPLKSQRKITIDVSQKDKINVSEIADSVLLITLDKRFNNTLNKVSDISFTERYFFIPKLNENNDHFVECILQFDLKGKFIREVGIKNDKSKEYIRIKNYQFIKDRNEIYIQYAHGNAFFDFSGNLIDFTDQHNLHNFKTIFNKNIWSVEVDYSFKTGDINYHLVSENIYNKKVDTLYTFLRLMDDESKKTKGGIIHGIPRYSVANGNLLISIHDLILKVDSENNITPMLQFDYINDVFFNYRHTFFSYRYASKNWIFHGYCNESFSNRFIYLFNYNTQTAYNIPIFTSQDGKVHSWINDDIYNSGYVQIKNASYDGYCYFIKNKEKFKDYKANIDNCSDRAILLVKLK